MMEHQLQKSSGYHRPKKRLGRGNASGSGNYSGRGMKGQKSRSGKGPRPGYEGGQLPLIKRLPMQRGFNNIFKIEYQLVKIGELNRFDKNQSVSPEHLLAYGLIDNLHTPTKILGDGEITNPLVVSAHKFTSSAARKITNAGGEPRLLT